MEPLALTPTILIAVVLYKMRVEDSPAMLSLAQCFAFEPSLERRFATLIWDNGPDPQPAPALPSLLEYHHSGTNVGLSRAYNYALNVGEERGDTWLLLLDQDTALPADFLVRMHALGSALQQDARAAAVAPTMLMGSTRVSPKLTSRWGKAVDPPQRFTGKAAGELIIMNSGMMLRVSALRKIGGYSEHFWLDFSDRYVCHMLAKHKLTAWLAGDIELQHHVSSMAGSESTSIERFKNLMEAQDAYFSMYKSFPRNIVFLSRLWRNSLQERRTDPERATLLRSYLLRRLTVRRSRRLAEWHRSLSVPQSARADQP